MGTSDFFIYIEKISILKEFMVKFVVKIGMILYETLLITTQTERKTKNGKTRRKYQKENRRALGRSLPNIQRRERKTYLPFYLWQNI